MTRSQDLWPQHPPPYHRGDMGWEGTHRSQHVLCINYRAGPKCSPARLLHAYTPWVELQMPAQARGSRICHLSHHRDSDTFRTDVLGRKQRQVQLDNALGESMKIKSRYEKAGSHQNRVLLQHSRSQHLRSAMVCLHGHVKDSSKHDTKLGPEAGQFAASPSCGNSFRMQHATTRVW